MARIRTIKPEFWKHEALSALPEATHMLAAALLNYADDHGYFNANPKLIQSECCPLRKPSVSLPESLRRLHEIGYLKLRITTDGRVVGHVVEFSTHQRVSHPTDSKIQAMTITWYASGKFPEAARSLPESFRPERKGREQGTGKGKEGNGDVANDAEAIRMAFDVFNVTARTMNWPVAHNLTPQRRSKIKQRLVDAGGIDGWTEAMAKARSSPHLNGSAKRSVGFEGWMPDLDFFLQQSSFTKLLEGSYDPHAPTVELARKSRILTLKDIEG